MDSSHNQNQTAKELAEKLTSLLALLPGSENWIKALDSQELKQYQTVIEGLIALYLDQFRKEQKAQETSGDGNIKIVCSKCGRMRNVAKAELADARCARCGGELIVYNEEPAE